MCRFVTFLPFCGRFVTVIGFSVTICLVWGWFVTVFGFSVTIGLVWGGIVTNPCEFVTNSAPELLLVSLLLAREVAALDVSHVVSDGVKGLLVKVCVST